jgi:hypothetical protein
LAIAARVTKYGLTLEDALWRVPLAMLNQLIVLDELAAGRSPRWMDSGVSTLRDIDQLLADALTPAV